MAEEVAESSTVTEGGVADEEAESAAAEKSATTGCVAGFCRVGVVGLSELVGVEGVVGVEIRGRRREEGVSNGEDLDVVEEVAE